MLEGGRRRGGWGVVEVDGCYDGSHLVCLLVEEFVEMGDHHGVDNSAIMDDTRRLLFRSDPMKYIQIFVPRDQAREVVSEIGRLECVEFVDLNADLSAFQRLFVDKIKLCDELNRSINHLVNTVQKAGIEIPEYAPIIGSPHSADETRGLNDGSGFDIDLLPETLSKITDNVEHLAANYENLARQNRELHEYHTVIDLASRFLNNSDLGVQTTMEGENEDAEYKQMELEPILDSQYPVSQSAIVDSRRMSEALASPGSFSVHEELVVANRLVRRLTGTVLESKRFMLERMIFRAGRGNVICRFLPIGKAMIDPQSGQEIEKLVFVLFFQGERIREKLLKILSTLNANVYSIPDSQSQQLQQLADVSRQIETQIDVLAKTKELRDNSLMELSSDLNMWRYYVAKERAIHVELNKFNPEMSKASLVAEGWVPHHLVSSVREALNRSSSFAPDSPGPVLAVIHPPPPHAGIVPTYFELNQFTSVFQSIVDAYGVPNYREFNPGVFTIITFPFLFAVMFGDIGHGILMTIAASFMILYQKRFLADKKLGGEMFQMIFGGRWIILLMGIFSIYIGFIYNEIFSLPLPFWGASKWLNITDKASTAVQTGVYPFGLDPGWHETTVSLAYYNSLKMKMAIIFGVTHMVTGIIVSLTNYIYFRKYIDIFFSFIPQMIFMLSIFGYLSVLILAKWSIDWKNDRPNVDPPSLLQMLINMFLSGNNDESIWIFSNQSSIENALKALAFVSVPFLLIPKPLILYWRHKKELQHAPLIEDSAHVEDNFNFGEICTMQLIHTLEFVLGCISNTASYLRLWALSLAHSQLSIVFWHYFIDMTMKMHWIVLFAGFAIWFACTLGVLMLMESLSAFLHALRLHWVEFQNKFFAGAGQPFRAFSIASITKSL